MLTLNFNLVYSVLCLSGGSIFRTLKTVRIIIHLETVF